MEAQRSPTRVNRRAVARGAAWSIPVVAVATNAPAYAASPCTGGAANTVTWARNTTGDANYTTQTGTVTGNTLSVSSAYSSTAAGVGSVSSTRNMATYPTGSNSPPSFELSNNIPRATLGDPQNYWQTATFTFTKRVAALTFTIEDIDSTTGNTAFWDRVAIIPETGATASGAFRSPSVLTGTGSLSSPWQTQSNDDARGYAAAQAVDVTISGGFTTFSIRYWTTVGAPANNSSSTTAQMWIRISGMTASSCAL